ncbi:MAG: GntR family transcriptional regulator [Lachnospiraceae bacterium]|nr:GntR family transcriptional regulator [Lachnospiraceae bacterium]
MIHLDFHSSQPIYEQIITQYKYLLLQGYLKEGDAIPSVRRLAMELDITPGTVAKAYRELEQQGLIATVRGKGTFIAGIPKAPPDAGVIDRVKEELQTLCMELIYQGLARDDIQKLMEEILEKLQGGKPND